MTAAADASWAVQMRAALVGAASSSSPFGCEVHLHPEVDSTNDVAAGLALGGAPEGTVVVAAAQHRGRGRRGATFHSPKGTGLYLSTVLRPLSWPSFRADPVGVPQAITLMAGVAVVEAAHACGVTAAELKWPNDVMVPHLAEGGWRKLAGILAEASSDAAGLVHVVLGIGMNVLAIPADVGLDDDATSVNALAHEPVSLERAATTLLTSLARAYRLLAVDGRLAVVEAWRRHAPSLPGRAVTWRDGTTWRSGRARGIDDSGALLVDTAPANAVALVSGEVLWGGGR